MSYATTRFERPPDTDPEWPDQHGTVAHRIDRKFFLWPLGCVVPLSALLPSQLVLHTGVPLFWWSGPMIVFGLVPLLDLLIGNDTANPSDVQAADMQEVRYYRWCIWLFVPMQLISLIVACYLWSHGALSLVDQLGLAVSVGLVGGIGINAAHELGHRHEKLERRMAKIALAQTFYGHFYVEHNRGHHARVATPGDPASARMGESLYRFLPRAVAGAVSSALRLEAVRLRRHGRAWWHPSNHVINAWALSVLLFGGLTAVFGVRILWLLLLQAVVGFLVLESVNYVEHYGLLRRRTESGRYARVSPRDSWNSDRLVTNVLLFHIQRHSDHHANPSRRYQTLRSWRSAPQLPAGYPSMIVLASIPPLFSRVMDPIVVAHYDGDVDRANIAPTRRGRRTRNRHRRAVGLPTLALVSRGPRHAAVGRHRERTSHAA